jgi:hypothetical protein
MRCRRAVSDLGHAGHHGPAVLLRIEPLHRVQAKKQKMEPESRRS